MYGIRTGCYFASVLDKTRIRELLNRKEPDGCGVAIVPTCV